MEAEAARRSFDRLSIDTAANINEDVTAASEFSIDSRHKNSESVFSSLRTSIDGQPSYINNFNILKQGTVSEEESSSKSSILGPNSIYDLTQALDSARIKSNKALRSQVTVNGGAQTVYNLNKPSTKEIPPIQLSPLSSKVSKETFIEELLEHVGEEYKAFESSYNQLTADVLSDFAKSYHERGSSDTQVELKDDAGQMDTIPLVFEDPQFRLDDPRVFRQVMQHSKILSDVDSSEAQLVDNFEVQEKLSHYLDTVEVQLISEISKTSDSFFSTLGDIKTIKTQSRACVEKLGTINSQLGDLEKTQSKIGLEILNLLDESRSINHLETTLFQLRAVLSSFADAQSSFKTGKNLECLQAISIFENLIGGIEAEDISNMEILPKYPKFQHKLVNMTRLPALRKQKASVNDLKIACSESYISEFLSLLIENLRTHCSSVDARDTINRMYAASDTSRKYDQAKSNKDYMVVSPESKDKLRGFIQNLAKSGNLTTAFTRYKDTIVTEIKALIRLGLPTEGNTEPRRKISNEQSNVEGTSNSPDPDFPLGTEDANAAVDLEPRRATLSGNIKSLTTSAFYEMMMSIISQLSECFRRLTTHQKLLLDLSLTSLSPEESQDIDVMNLDITGAINKAIEITQVRLVKVLNVRSEQLGDLPVYEYLKIYSLSSIYLSECESINPGFNFSDAGRSLNEWLKNHVSYYLHRFHSNSVKGMASLCDKEPWREYTGDDIGDIQDLLDKVVSYSDYVETGEGFDGSKWSKSMLDIYQGSDVSTQAEYKAVDTPPVKIKLRNETFYIPHLIISVIRNTADYIILSAVFANRSSNIKQSLFTFLKVLNSRISLAILNAGATRTAGLKHITTKHLALCIQTVDFLGVFCEKIQEIFRPVTDSSQNASDQPTFTTAIDHFKDHKSELISKLVSIMHDRTLSHCEAIKKLDLAQSVSPPKQCRPYMETLVKETLTVTKVISKYLNSVDCSLIMSQIFDNYKKLLVNCFCAELSQLKDFNEKHSLLKDIDYFRVKLGEVSGYGNSGQVIWENVNSLPTVEDTEMEEKMRHNIESEISTSAIERNGLTTNLVDQEKPDVSERLDAKSADKETTDPQDNEKWSKYINLD